MGMPSSMFMQKQPPTSTPTQRCGSGGIEVVDGTLLARLEFPEGSPDASVFVLQTTVNRYR